MKRTLHTLALWLWIGASGGALVLLFVAVPLEAALANGGSQPHTDRVLSLLALAWLLLSLLLARRLATGLAPRRLMLAHLVGGAAAAVAFFAFLAAGAGPLARFRGEVRDLDRFTFGGVPDAAVLRGLRAEGYVGIISLLSNEIPFERVLVSRVRAAAAEAGLSYVHIPMLPWISRNVAALDTLRALARRGSGRWYVHCYLGRHRVELARFALAEAAGLAAERPHITLPDGLERGPLIRVDSALILGPLPTRDEWFEVVVRSGTRRVVALLDSASAADRPWIAAERAEAENTGIALIVTPVRRQADARRVAALIRASPVRTYAHGFHTDERVRWLEAALRAGGAP